VLAAVVPATEDQRESRRLRPAAAAGTTDRTRYIEVTTLEEAERPELHEWIAQAACTRVGSRGHRA
jgi:hypothetical protein